jgi:DNA-binding MarR family transcriptional regulator
LARTTGIGRAPLTGIVDRLEANGYITRTRSQEDLRIITLTMTNAGEQVLASVPSLVKKRFQRKLK